MGAAQASAILDSHHTHVMSEVMAVGVMHSLSFDREASCSRHVALQMFVCFVFVCVETQSMSVMNANGHFA